MADSRNYNPFDMQDMNNEFLTGLQQDAMTPPLKNSMQDMNNEFLTGLQQDAMTEYQPPSGMGLGFDYKPMSTYTPDKNPLNFQPLTMGNVANYGGSYLDGSDGIANNNGFDFGGFNQSQMKTDGSLASVGAGIGALAGGPVGSAIGAVGGTAVDMYLSYQANEERKKADRQRLEEARRQQQFSNRQAERDRKLAASQYGDKMGFLNAQEDRTQATFEANTKQNRLNMLQNAMTNSLKNSEMVRNIFAKRGVV